MTNTEIAEAVAEAVQGYRPGAGVHGRRGCGALRMEGQDEARWAIVP